MKRTIGGLALLTLVWPLATVGLRGDEPQRPDTARAAFRQLGNLRAELAFKAKEQHEVLRAAHLYLHAAQAFRRAGDAEEADAALTAGTLAARPLRATWPHPKGAVAMTFLPGDRQAVTVGADGDVHFWDAVTGREVRSFRAEEADEERGRIAGAAFSRNRSWLLLWGRKTVQLWDVSGGRLVHKWDEDKGPRGAAFLLNDRRVLLFGDPETKPRLWDMEKQRPAGEVAKGSPPEGRLTASPDGRRFFTADAEALYLWDAAGAKLLHAFRAGKDERGTGFQAVFSRDGKQLLVFGFKDGAARLCDPDGKLVRKLSAEAAERDRREFDGAEFSADGKRLLTWAREGTSRVWDVEEGKLLRAIQGGGEQGARLSHDGSYVLTLGEPARVWYVGGDNPGEPFAPGGAGTFTRNGKRVILWGGKGRNAEVWSDYPRLLLSLTCRRDVDARHEGEEPLAAEAVLSDDENLLLVREPPDEGAAVRLWHLRDLKDWNSYREAPVPPALTFKHDHPVLTGALDRAEARVLTCDAGGQAHLWGARDGRRLRSFRHGRSARGAAFHPDGAHVITWGEGGVRLWDLKTGMELETLANEAEVRSVAFDPDGSHLLAWDVDYAARWWDLRRGKVVYSFEHRRDLFGAALDRKGTRALTWGLDGDAKVWDVTTGALLRTLEHGTPVSGAAFAPEQDRVWTWTGEGFSEWALKTGKRLRLLKPRFPGYPEEHKGVEGVVTAELSRDGRRFLLCDPGAMVHYWDIASGRELPPRRNPYTKDVYRGLFHWALNADQTRAATPGPEGSVLLYHLGSGLELQVFRHEKGVRGFAFSRDDKRLLTWAEDRTAKLWQTESPRPWAPDDQLLDLEHRSGFRVDEFAQLRALTFAEWQTRRERLEKVVRKKYER